MRDTVELPCRTRGLPERTSENTQRRVASHFPANSEAPPRHLFDLPNELLYLIIGHTELPCRMSLALSCKFLMSLAFPGNVLPRLNHADKREFLLSLQRDLPKSYLCPCCHELQRLEPGLNWEGQGHKWTCDMSNGYMLNSIWRTSHIELYKHIIFSEEYYKFMKHGNISFMDAYLTMNRHSYGPLHGISLRHLERCVSFETDLDLDKCLHGIFRTEENMKRARHRACGFKVQEPTFNWIPEEQPRKKGVWRFSLRYRPKIIDNKLYIARFFTIVGPSVPWADLARLLNSIQPKICNHMSCMITMYPITPMYSWTIPCGHSGAFDFEFFPERMRRYWKACGFTLETGSCLLCNTDYDVSLTKDDTKEEWNFSCSSYHCLGQCQTPMDRLWNYFANTGGERTGFLRYYYLSHDEGRPYAPDGNELIFGHPTMNGEVRRKWLEKSTESESL
ncbi:hypothetical protein ACSS6W_007349 [Trichoderma asperelloides]